MIKLHLHYLMNFFLNQKFSVFLVLSNLVVQSLLEGLLSSDSILILI